MPSILGGYINFMLKIYKSNDTHLNGLSLLSLERGAWLSLINPTEEELEAVAASANVPHELLKAALDDKERPRLEIEENHMLIITNIPFMHSQNSYDTLPLGIILTSNHIITVCLRNNDILSDFTPENARLFSTYKKTRFLLQILYKSATLYLKFVIEINNMTEKIEKDLLRSMRNEEIYQLLELEKSLTFFGASLKSNGMVLTKLLRLRNNNRLNHLIKMYEDDEELLEDVIIENKQAMEMVEMYSHILTGMMSTFTSIISNNINQVMKLFTAVSIILTIPTMISGIFGMNFELPFQNEYGFWYIIILCIVASCMVTLGLWRRGLF
jgi:magnesium transporter